MKAFIMAAGFGKRLEPLTLAVPKPMVPVINRPIMQLNLELLKKHGLREICANIHYFPEQIENFFGDGSAFGVHLTYSFEEKLLGTAGGVKKMASLVGGVNDTFLVTSSDALTDIDLQKLIEFHKKKKAVATIALYSVLDTSQFGVVVLNKDKRIEAFQEKPLPGKALSNLANTGIYIFEPEILEMIPDNASFDFGADLFPHLVNNKHGIYGYEMEDYWSDIGSVEHYLSANGDAIAGRVKLGLAIKKFSTQALHGKHVAIGREARIFGPVMIGDRVVIEDGVEILGPSIIGDKCLIGQGAKIVGSVIWSDTKIGAGSKIDESVIGNWCQLEESSIIGSNSVIGNRTRITKGSVIGSGTKLKPDTVV